MKKQHGTCPAVSTDRLHTHWHHEAGLCDLSGHFRGTNQAQSLKASWLTEKDILGEAWICSGFASLAVSRQEGEAVEAGKLGNLQTTEGPLDCAKELEFHHIGNEGL